VLRPGLDALIEPIRRETFFAKYWCSQHLLVQKPGICPGECWARLANMSVREILRVAEDPVVVMHTTHDGQYRGTRVAASDAYEFYESGMGLYFNLTTKLDDVRQWTAQLADDLGHLGSRCVPSVFISPAGWTTELHFDSNENFTLQLRGLKAWRLAPNTAVANPVDRFTASGSIPERLKQYHSGSDLLGVGNCSIVELTPGSVLYVPRGYWHSVDSLEESVSVNLCIMPETWASFLLLVLPYLLLTSPELREVATGITGCAELRPQACMRLDKALETASLLLSEVRVEDLIPDARFEPTIKLPQASALIHRNRLARISVEKEGLCAQSLTVMIGGFTRPGGSFGTVGLSEEYSTFPVKKTTLTLDDSQCRLAAWLLSRDSFRVDDILQEFCDIEPNVVTQFIAAIVEAGLFRAVTPRCRVASEPGMSR